MRLPSPGHSPSQTPAKLRDPGQPAGASWVAPGAGPVLLAVAERDGSCPLARRGPRVGGRAGAGTGVRRTGAGRALAPWANLSACGQECPGPPPRRPCPGRSGLARAANLPRGRWGRTAVWGTWVLTGVCAGAYLQNTGTGRSSPRALRPPSPCSGSATVRRGDLQVHRPQRDLHCPCPSPCHPSCALVSAALCANALRLLSCPALPPPPVSPGTRGAVGPSPPIGPEHHTMELPEAQPSCSAGRVTEARKGSGCALTWTPCATVLSSRPRPRASPSPLGSRGPTWAPLASLSGVPELPDAKWTSAGLSGRPGRAWGDGGLPGEGSATLGPHSGPLASTDGGMGVRACSVRTQLPPARITLAPHRLGTCDAQNLSQTGPEQMDRSRRPPGPARPPPPPAAAVLGVRVPLWRAGPQLRVICPPPSLPCFPSLRV